MQNRINKQNGSQQTAIKGIEPIDKLCGIKTKYKWIKKETVS